MEGILSKGWSQFQLNSSLFFFSHLHNCFQIQVTLNVLLSIKHILDKLSDKQMMLDGATPELNNYTLVTISLFYNYKIE